VIECVVPEEDRSCLPDVHVVLEESLFIRVRLVDLTLSSVLFDEPVRNEASSYLARA
jgi:hypothetical protein